MKKLHIVELEKKMLNNEISDELLSVVNIFLSSINDWPTSVLTICEYEKEVEEFIKECTTKNNIKKSLKEINFNNNSWEAESLAQIVDVFQFYKRDLSLKNVIEDLEIKLQ